jgi:hypothetical protein
MTAPFSSAPASGYQLARAEPRAAADAAPAPGGGGAPAAAPAAAPAEEAESAAAPIQETAAAFDPKEAVRQLNLLRSSRGCWELCGQVLALLVEPLPHGERPAAQERLRGLRPGGLSEQQWASVLVLALLRKHCGSEQGLWEGMERKALEWLQAGWPQGQQGLRSPAATVLGAGKLL